jgi:hypothetical protein
MYVSFNYFIYNVMIECHKKINRLVYLGYSFNLMLMSMCYSVLYSIEIIHWGTSGTSSREWENPMLKNQDFGGLGF